MTARRRRPPSTRSRPSVPKLRDMMPWIKKNKLVDQSKN